MDTRKLHLDYPCPWDYHVIGESEERLRAAIAAIVGDAEHVLTFSKRSAKGRYVSLHLTVRVTDEAHRHGLFAELRRHADVRYVL